MGNTSCLCLVTDVVHACVYAYVCALLYRLGKSLWLRTRPLAEDSARWPLGAWGLGCVETPASSVCRRPYRLALPSPLFPNSLAGVSPL